MSIENLNQKLSKLKEKLSKLKNENASLKASNDNHIYINERLSKALQKHMNKKKEELDMNGSKKNEKSEKNLGSMESIGVANNSGSKVITGETGGDAIIPKKKPEQSP